VQHTICLAYSGTAAHTSDTVQQLIVLSTPCCCPCYTHTILSQLHPAQVHKALYSLAALVPAATLAADLLTS
jgi:hypothetical protein